MEIFAILVIQNKDLVFGGHNRYTYYTYSLEHMTENASLLLEQCKAVETLMQMWLAIIL